MTSSSAAAPTGERQRQQPVVALADHRDRGDRRDRHRHRGLPPQSAAATRAGRAGHRRRGRPDRGRRRRRRQPGQYPDTAPTPRRCSCRRCSRAPADHRPAPTPTGCCPAGTTRTTRRCTRAIRPGRPRCSARRAPRKDPGPTDSPWDTAVPRRAYGPPPGIRPDTSRPARIRRSAAGFAVRAAHRGDATHRRCRGTAEGRRARHPGLVKPDFDDTDTGGRRGPRTRHGGGPSGVAQMMPTASTRPGTLASGTC